MEFVKKEDILDPILKNKVTDYEIAFANEQVLRLAKTYGADEEKLNPSSLLKTYAQALVCRECALYFSGTDPTVQLEGRQDDIYERKYKLYSERVNEIAKNIQLADFIGADSEEETSWTKVITISRG